METQEPRKKSKYDLDVEQHIKEYYAEVADAITYSSPSRIDEFIEQANERRKFKDANLISNLPFRHLLFLDQEESQNIDPPKEP